jgi:hypothetical protein
MRIITVVGIIFMLAGCAGHHPRNKQLYTAHNIWNHRGQLYCINYKVGDRILPAGTAVKNVKVRTKNNLRLITFRVAQTDERYSIAFNPRWHPGETAKSYKKKMFTRQPFDQRTRELTPEEIESIKRGVVTPGMSKRAVLIAYGPPPEHRTRSLDSDQWIYWQDRFRDKRICFDGNKRTVHCDE